MSRLPKRVRHLAYAGAASLVSALIVFAASNKQSPGSGLVLGVVGLLVFGVLWLYRKSQVSSESATCMHVVERLSLEQGRTLHLVEVQGQRLLLASHQSGIGLISVFDEKHIGDLFDAEGDVVS